MKLLLTAIGALSLLGACASSRPDHFYILSTQPPGASQARTAPATPVALRVTLPSLMDRSGMVINDSTNRVIVLEHERWAASLGDLTAQALARDLERRRSDLLVGGPGSIHAGTALKVNVDVVQMTLKRGDAARIEAHWRILDPRNGKDTVGGEVFTAPMGQDDYAAVAQALSQCLGLLADRLAEQLH